MDLGKHFADEFFRLLIWAFVLVSGFWIAIGSSIYFFNKKPYCTSSQLHEVIAAVEKILQQ